MDLVQLSITDDQLKQSNELTKTSIKPGYLDTAAYRQYLIINGHVDPDFIAAAGSAPTIPQASSLQANNGDRTDNMTDYRADQALWSQDNLPEVIYIFQKPANRFTKSELREPPKKIYNIYGAILRDIPILPDHIASDVEGWRLEAWFRFDARVSLMDIMDRIEPQRRLSGKSVLNMRSFRFRDDCKILGWCAMGKKFHEKMREIETDMASKGISPVRNSTRGVSWGLIDMSTGADGPRIDVPYHRRVRNTVDLTGIGSNSVVTPPAPASTATGALQSRPPVLTPSTPVKPKKPIFDHAELGHNDVAITMGDHASAVIDDLPVLPYNEIDTEEWFNVSSDALAPSNSNQVADPVVAVMYDGTPLILKTHRQRLGESERATELLKQWYPFGHKGRRAQLAYLLDPERLGGGFVDNVGYWPPIGVEHGCIEADIVYGQDTL